MTAPGKRGRTLTDRDVAFCLEQLAAGVKLFRLAFYVYGISRRALGARLTLAKTVGVKVPHPGHDPVGGGWVPAPPPPTPAEAALEYITTRSGATSQDVAAVLGVSTNWARALIRRLHSQGLVTRRGRERRSWAGYYVYDAVVVG